MKITREEGLEALTKGKQTLAESTTKEEVLAVLKDIGEKVGYAPAFRCLVAGKAPEQSIRWS